MSGIASTTASSAFGSRTGGAHISGVRFEYFNSDSVTKQAIEQELIGSVCNKPGKLYIKLDTNKRIQQKGPFILPPIRWLDSFDDGDSFFIVCEVNN